jgi:hypothetical protein
MTLWIVNINDKVIVHCVLYPSLLPKQNVGNTTYMGTNIINCFTDISNIF